MELVTDLTLVIAAALVGGALAQRLRQPLLVGYILAGVAIGPFTGGLTAILARVVTTSSDATGCTSAGDR